MKYTQFWPVAGVPLFIYPSVRVPNCVVRVVNILPQAKDFRSNLKFSKDMPIAPIGLCEESFYFESRKNRPRPLHIMNAWKLSSFALFFVSFGITWRVQKSRSRPHIIFLFVFYCYYFLAFFFHSELVACQILQLILLYLNSNNNKTNKKMIVE